MVASHFLVHKPETEASALTTLKQAQDYIEENYNKILVIAMIIQMSIGSYLAFIRSGFNFAENLVLNAYVIGHLVIADVIRMLISLSTLNEEHRGIYRVCELLLKYPFWFITYWRFFRPSKWYWGVLQLLASQNLTGLALSASLIVAAYAVLKLKGH